MERCRNNYPVIGESMRSMVLLAQNYIIHTPLIKNRHVASHSYSSVRPARQKDPKLMCLLKSIAVLFLFFLLRSTYMHYSFTVLLWLTI
jgi:hypothetical protein